MKFNPFALVTFMAFAALLTAATSSGSNSVHVAEAVCTVVIGISLGGLALVAVTVVIDARPSISGKTRDRVGTDR